MELYQLRTFVTVADTGNLTQASERLFTSQPAVSAHIKALEEELEIKLFDRTPKGMRLTDNGITLREKAQLVLNAGNDLKLKAKTLQGILTGQARIGLNTDAEYLLLAKWHLALMSQYPSLKIQLTQGTSVELIKKVSSGIIDICFFSGDYNYDEIEHIELCTTHAVIAAAPKWKEQLSDAGREELAQLPWIYPEPLCIYHKFIRHVFAETKNQPTWITSSATEDSTIALLRSGVGLAFIRDDEADTLLKKGEIIVWPGEAFTLPLRIGYLKSRKEDPVVKALLKVIVEKFSDRCRLNKSHP
ncbi:MAG: LysR family transcriptional regulator, partial [Cocleimonas sp.]